MVNAANVYSIQQEHSRPQEYLKRAQKLDPYRDGLPARAKGQGLFGAA